MVAWGSFVVAAVAASGAPEYMHISGVASPRKYLNGDYHLAGENTNGAPAWHNPTTYNNWIQKIDMPDLTGAVRHCWAVVDDADRHASPAVAILRGQPCLENYTNPSDVPHWVDVVGGVLEGSMQVTGQDTPMDQPIPREVRDNLKHLAISDVPTDNLAHQDGYYTATDEVVFGANVWRSDQSSDRWLFRTAFGQWELGNTLAKQGATGGLVFLVSAGLDGYAYPTDVPKWDYPHFKQWFSSSLISVKAVTPCDAKDCSGHGATSDPDNSDGCKCRCDDGYMGSTCSMLKNSSSGLRCQVAQSINLTQLGNYFLDPLSQQPVLDWLNSCCCSRNCSFHPFVGDLRPHDVCPCPADEVSKGKDNVKECLKTVFNEPAGTGFLIGDDKSKRCVTFKHELTGVISGTDDAESAYFDDCSGNGFLSVISSFDADESYLQMGEDATLEFHNKSVYSPGKPPYKLSAPHGSGNRLRFVNHGLVEADGTAIVGYVIGTDGMVANDYCWRSFGACTDLPPLIWVPKARPASSGHSVALAEAVSVRLPEKWDTGAGGGEAAQEVRKGWRIGTFGQASCMGLACLAAMLAWRRRAVSSDAAVPLLA